MEDYEARLMTWHIIFLYFHIQLPHLTSLQLFWALLSSSIKHGDSLHQYICSNPAVDCFAGSSQTKERYDMLLFPFPNVVDTVDWLANLALIPGDMPL